MLPMLNWFIGSSAVIGLLASNCYAAISVVALTDVVGDLVRQVGNHCVKVSVLPRSNPHAIELTPRDAAQLDACTLILASGMGLDGGIERTRYEKKIVVVSAGIEPLCAASGCAGCSPSSDKDPHWWHSISATKIAVTNICDALSAADPACAQTYRIQADAYIKQLDALDRHARLQIARIPMPNRILVTPHTALSYFARDFRFDTAALFGTDGQSSPRSLATLLTRLKKTKIFFSEMGENEKSILEIARTAGATIGGSLCVDNLGDYTTYESMMLYNIETITRALAPEKK